jgi:hypothetical protein
MYFQDPVALIPFIAAIPTYFALTMLFGMDSIWAIIVSAGFWFLVLDAWFIYTFFIKPKRNK